MVIHKRLFRKWNNLQNINECFYFQRKLQTLLGYWPQNDLRNWRFFISTVAIFLFALSPKSNFLIKAIIAEDYKIAAIVFPEFTMTFGFFWVGWLMLRTEKILKLFMDDFKVEWDLCKIFYSLFKY